ncbi:MAG: FxsA family protein [Gammaproteobacteria bacterium]
MRGFPVAAALFIGIPLIEIYLFIELGGLIGALPTVLLIIVTAIIGVSLLRAQGFNTMAKFQQEVGTGQLPATTMLEGVALIIGGALLLTPGFLTDSIGFLCLIPFTRQAIIAWAIKNMKVTTGGFNSAGPTARPRDPDVIEGEIIENDKEPYDQNK